MQDYNHILKQLNRFIRKHYSQVLLKGILLFFAFGLLFFLIVLGVEHFLWLGTTGRMLLFSIFVLVELYLLFRYILTPIFYLFRLKQGIGPKDAAQMIGKHFSEIGDKLTNLLDLADDKQRSELLLASISQRSKQLDSMPFSSAVTYKEAFGYTKFAVIPLVILLALYISGNWGTFFGSYERVVNYEMAYEKPAPFKFELLTSSLNVLEDEAFTIQIATKGDVKPENVYATIEGKDVLLQKENGFYIYTFSPPIRTSKFNFKANDVTSRAYTLTSLKTPSIVNFTMELNYPAYLKKSNETIKSTGNALIPEGTRVTWKIEGKNTDEIKLITKDSSYLFLKEKDAFKYGQRIYNDLNYQLTTTNKNVKDYERLAYDFQVIKDSYPTIKVNQVLDSVNPNVSYFTGNATDDYGISNIVVTYFEVGNEKEEKSVSLSKPTSNFEQFYYTFPSGLDIAVGKNYGFYFQVTDNDAIHKGKSVKSQVFQQILLDENQLKNKNLESQQSLIKDLDKSLERAKEQKETLEELNQNQKEKGSLNFNDQNQIKDFLKKHERQEQLMQKFSKELAENLDKGDKNDKLNQLLQERLERQEIEAKKNEKLLEELNKTADKINKEELTKRLEELGKKQQNNERSLEQLLELTKRYYVTEKASQLARDLEELAKKQEKLSEEKDENKDPAKQQKLNDEFEALSKELDALKKDNEALKKPIDIKVDDDKKEGVKENQKTALEELEKEENSDTNKESKAEEKQKSAAQKMREMSEQLGESSSGGGGSSVAEDAEMLRQILDNLIVFSFKQEVLFDKLSEKGNQEASHYSETVRDQNELRGLFEHVDDSLFALSLRQAELSEFVNEQITEVYYNIDKSLETMADGQTFQGISHQKYVLTAANSLADFLAEVMDNMQQSLQMGKGSGKSEGGFQLPDIIKGQQQLGKKMGKQGKSGSKGKEGKEGQNGEGKQGEEGEQGEGGQEGKSAKEGQGGEQGSKGENGKNGKNGQGGKKGGQGQVSEAELKEIYEIYQNQQKIRQELENQLQNMINAGDQKLGEKLVIQMEDFQNDLLENGITQRTINKATTIQYELLKLENAALKQGKKSERESSENKQDFTNPITTKPSLLDNYRNEVEILNKQSLPLRQNFQNKVKEYFKAND